MSKMSFALSMLALSGMAGQAAAVITSGGATSNVTTTTLNLPGVDPSSLGVDQFSFSITPITLGGKSAPQFYFLTEGIGSADNSVDGGVIHTGIDILLTAENVSGLADFGTAPDHSAIANPYAGTPFSTSSFGVKTITPGLPTLGEGFHGSFGLTGLYKGPTTFNDQPFSGNLLPLLAGGDPIYVHVKFDPNGANYIGSFATSPDGGVATVSFVPEPDVWALLIAGAAMTGGALRSRRRKAAVAA